MATVCRAGDLVRVEYGIFLAMVPAQRVGAILNDVRILRSVYHQQAGLGVLLRCAAGCLSVRLERAGNGRDIVQAVAAGLPPAAGQGRRDAERFGCKVVPGAVCSQCAGLEQRTTLILAAEGRDAGHHLDGRPFVAFAVRAAPLTKAQVEEVSAAALERRAERSVSGKVLPLASARRMIPAHAFALKKYFEGIEPCSSTCDNEHTAASLGQAEILGIQNPPRGCSLGSIHTTSVLPFAPWRLEFFGFAHQGAEEAAEGVFLVREDAWNVLPPCDALGLTAAGSNKVNCIDGLHELDG